MRKIPKLIRNRRIKTTLFTAVGVGEGPACISGGLYQRRSGGGRFGNSLQKY